MAIVYHSVASSRLDGLLPYQDFGKLDRLVFNKKPGIIKREI